MSVDLTPFIREEIQHQLSENYGIEVSGQSLVSAQGLDCLAEDAYNRLDEWVDTAALRGIMEDSIPELSGHRE